MNDQRAARRVCVNMAGRIELADRSSVPCVIHDLSRWGVRLKLVGTERVPDRFTLTCTATDAVIGCETVWRSADEIGALTDLME